MLAWPNEPRPSPLSRSLSLLVLLPAQTYGEQQCDETAKLFDNTHSRLERAESIMEKSSVECREAVLCIPRMEEKIDAHKREIAAHVAEQVASAMRSAQAAQRVEMEASLARALAAQHEQWAARMEGADAAHAELVRAVQRLEGGKATLAQLQAAEGAQVLRETRVTGGTLAPGNHSLHLTPPHAPRSAPAHALATAHLSSSRGPPPFRFVH
jgi:hypothetical protein